MPASPPEQPPPTIEAVGDEGAAAQGAAALAAASTPLDVGELLGIPWRTLAWVLYGHGAAGYYKTWSITKRSGGTRDICAPRSILWRAQHALHGILRDAYKPRPSVHGFVSRCSVATNARPHINRRFILNVDIEDFFPSIHFGRVRGLFLAHPFQCASEVATVLARICCSDGALPIGAPTSPVIANMICVGLDREFQKLAKRHACWYTRYADDLTFSTNLTEFPQELAVRTDLDSLRLGNELVHILRSNSFRPNLDKCRLKSRHDRQVVTGVVVNERPNVSRKYVRQIRAMLHAWNKYGLEKAQEHLTQIHDRKHLDPVASDRYPGAAPDFANVLRGRIGYLSMVRGSSDSMVRRFKDQFDNLSAGKEINEGLELYTPEPYRPPPELEPLGRRELLTVMFTDIVDSTENAASMGDATWRAIRRRHDRLIKSEVSRRWGRILKWMGDGCLAVFDHPSDAVLCARRIASRVEPLGIQIRIGLHTGEVRWEGNDVHGTGVNISSRVGGRAAPSEVLVTRTVKDLIEGSGIVLEKKAVLRLKGVSGSWTVYRAVDDPTQSTTAL